MLRYEEFIAKLIYIVAVNECGTRNIRAVCALITEVLIELGKYIHFTTRQCGFKGVQMYEITQKVRFVSIIKAK